MTSAQTLPLYPPLAARLAARHLPALDGMRALAVGLVILYHFGFEAVPGQLGVLVFFVLSGFLITWLLLGEDERTGGVSLRGFYARRVLRIFPAFYAYFLLSAGLLLVTGRAVNWGAAASALFYLGDYHSAIFDPPPHFLSHTWSLAIEEQFYLLWPVLFLALRRDLRRLTWCLAALIAAVWVHRAALHLAGVSPRYIYFALDTRLDHLLIGCLLAVLLRRGGLDGLWRFACRGAYMPAFTLLALAASVAARAYLGEGYRNLLGFSLEPLLVAALIAQLITFSRHAAWRWVDGRALSYVGRLSYSLYLYQQIVIAVVRKALAGAPVAVQLLAAVAVTSALAAASYYLIERPFLRLKDRLSAAADRTAPAAAVAGGAVARPPAREPLGLSL
jgi:peptidoglycan/LPS O-acetylase OafA/YrhL